MEHSQNRDTRIPESTTLTTTNPNDELSFHDVLKNSYAPRSQQLGAFKNQGYVFDGDLSNDNEQVYYNPKKGKLLYSIAGTHNLSDVGTDAYAVLGKFKDTNRYKEAKDILDKAKKRYNPKEVSVAGHSIGGLASQYVAGKNDKVTTLDKAGIFQPTRSNEKSYRSSGDIVSLLSKSKTLKNPNYKTGILPIDALNAHNVSNIKNDKIYV
jgi:triacylglycerol esterase/lipase EstA (alpha/beta hydrolase family)